MGDKVSELQLIVNELGRRMSAGLGFVQRDAAPAPAEAALRLHGCALEFALAPAPSRSSLF